MSTAATAQQAGQAQRHDRLRQGWGGGQLRHKSLGQLDALQALDDGGGGRTVCGILSPAALDEVRDLSRYPAGDRRPVPIGHLRITTRTATVIALALAGYRDEYGVEGTS